jgi:Arc/MetJ family transcription regulator
VSESKVAMSYRLSPAKIARAQAILGTSTATATIEEALDAIVFRRELMDGVERAFGTPIVDAFPDDGARSRAR